MKFAKPAAARPATTVMIGSKLNVNCDEAMLLRKARITSTPVDPAPQLFCPVCVLPLLYRQTVFSGMHPVERWDQYACRSCGAFEYRHRTRQLRPVG
jgi:hypothetical protein